MLCARHYKEFFVNMLCKLVIFTDGLINVMFELINENVKYNFLLHNENVKSSFILHCLLSVLSLLCTICRLRSIEILSERNTVKVSSLL